ncbi:MAG: hypothetical protein ACLTQI_00295 [Slackia sp.]
MGPTRMDYSKVIRPFVPREAHCATCRQ